jgi:hypothetical protein
MPLPNQKINPKTCIKIDPQKQPINKPRLPDNSPHPVQEKTTFKAQISQNHPHFTTPKKTRNKFRTKPGSPQIKSTPSASILQKI